MSELQFTNVENFRKRLAEGQTDLRLDISEIDESSFVPSNYSVSNWEKDEEVVRSYEIVTDYLSEDRGMGSYLIDQATTGQDTDPAEFMRDLTMRLGAPLSVANSLKDAPEEVKAAFRTMKSKWDKASLTGAGEKLDAIKDYGADILFNPEVIGTAAGVLSGVLTGGTSTIATLGARKTAQVAANKTLMDAVRATAASATKNPLKASALVGSIHGGFGSHLAQELDISADIKSEEDYSVGENIFGTAAGAVLGPTFVKGFGLMGKGGKLARDYFSEGTRPPKSIPSKDAPKAFNEAVEAEDIPESGAKLLEQLTLKLEDDTPKGLKGVWKPVPKQGELDFGDDINKAIDNFVEDLGGGEKTRKEVQQTIRIAADGKTVRAKRSKLVQGLYTIASDISGNFYGKAAGILSPITNISGTATELQKKLSYEFGTSYRNKGQIVEKDLSEVQREITGGYNERFRAIVDGLSLSEIDTKLAEDVNSALSLSMRSVKPVKHANFDDATNVAITQAAKEIKSLYNEMGVRLFDIGVFTKMVDNYVPRMWKRSAVENNQKKLRGLFVTKAGMSKSEAARTVEKMLEVENQVDQGTAGGYFFSAKRKIDTIGNDADFEEFLNNDVLGTLHAYTYQAGKSLAKHRVLGVNNFKQFQKFYVNRIREEVEKAGETFTPKMSLNIEKLYRSATGEGQERFGRTGQNIVDGYSFANRVGLLGLATLSSLTEVMINISKSGVRNSVKGFGDAMKQSHKTITKDLETKLKTEHGLTAKEALSEMRSFSIHVDQALAQVGDRLAGDELVSETLQTASNKFFRLNMLDQWTKFVQSVSFSSGKHLINDNIKKLASYGSDPLDKIGEDLAEELGELGIDYKKAVGWHNSGSKTDDAFYKSDILGGAARYTNAVVLQPTAMSGLKPMLYSNPKTAVLFQLLSYPVAFTNTVMKGAAKQLIKNPKRNAGKITAAATIMTGMARWTNYMRTGGENEKNKDTDEIIYSAIARWGGNGILVDSLQRARTAAKYSGSNLSYATMPFGPAASDGISLIQQGIIPTVGNKVPFISGSYFGKQILGEKEVTHYRRLLKEKQEEVFGGLIPEFEETPRAAGFYTGGVVSAARAAAKPIAELFSGVKAVEPQTVFANKVDRIVKETEDIFNPETIKNTFDDMDNTLAELQMEGLIEPDNYNLDDFAEAAVVAELRKKFKPLNELESNPDWVKAIQSGNTEASKNWEAAQKSMGFNQDEIIALKTIEELKDEVDPYSFIRDIVSTNMQKIKNTHDKLNIKITEADIDAASKAKFDEDSLDATHQFLTQVIDSGESTISSQGASKIARNAIIKLAADGEIDFSKFKAPKIAKTQEADEALDSSNQAASIEKYVANSQKKDIVYRAIQTFKDREFNVAFTFPREMGTHVGTKGVANTIKLRNMMFDVYDGEKAGSMYTKFKNKKPDQVNYEKEFEALQRLGKAADYEFEDTIVQQGYIDVKNPLVYKGETAVGKWSADEILASEEGLKELIENINLSGVKVTPKIEKKLNALSEKAKRIQTQPKETMLEKLKAELMGYELTTDLRTELQGMGFDSIKYKNEIEFGFRGESENSYILFEPNQFKFTTATKFDADDPRHAFNAGGIAKILAPKLSSGFFSAAHKAALKLEGSKPKAGQSFINKLKKDNAVTEEELEWTGAIEKFGNNKPVTKDEVVRHFQDAEFDFEVYTGRHVDRKENVDEYDLPIDDLDDGFENPDKDFWNWLEDNHPHEVELADELADSTEWTSWFDGRYEEFKKDKGSDFITQPSHIDFSFDGPFTENYREIVIGLKDKFKKVSKDYKNEAHHPTLKNQLLHIRLADIEDVNALNKKTLLIDELQSDKSTDATGPEGVGYAMKDEDIEVGNNTRDKARDLMDEYSDLTSEMEELEEILEEMSPDELASPRGERVRSEYDRVEARREESGDEYDKLQTGEDIMIDYRIPNLPLKDEARWALVGLRKAMITAAEEGYDQVALTTGHIQKIRNNKIIDADKTTLSQFPNKDLGGYVVRTFDSEGGYHSKVFADPEDAEKYLKKTIGKESYDALMKSEPNEMGDYSLNTEHSFQRGGKRFEEFYDKSLPELLKKHFGKKYNTKIKYEEYQQGSKTVKLPTIKITPQMREDIRRGLPMFAEGGEVKKEHATKLSSPVQGSTIAALTSNLKEEK
ncbi:hypothetical protein N8469_00290 [bacterium]|nr:hypothetical protein [bacterium]